KARHSGAVVRSCGQHHGAGRAPAAKYPVTDLECLAFVAVEIWQRDMDQPTGVEPYLIDREIAEISDLVDDARRDVFLSIRLVPREIDLFRPQRQMHGLAGRAADPVAD